MTRNEKIAEKMGWVGNYWGSLLERRTPDNDIVLAKILQQRMVDDGWELAILIDGKHFVGLAFWPGEQTGKHRVEAATEPAAIIELFCRVYEIDGVG